MPTAAGNGAKAPAPSPGQASLVVQDLQHWFGSGANTRQVLDRVSLTIHRGEVVLLTGPSGCGKTTFLTLVGALRQVMAGSVQLFGQELNGAGRRERQLLRRQIGMIFQGHNLLRCLSAEQNVQMGADLLPGLGFPVFARGLCMRGTGKDFGATGWLNAPVMMGDIIVKPGDLVAGDIDGVVAIPRARVADVVDARRDLAREESWRAFIIHSVSQRCASYFDDGQASHTPDRAGGLYASWLRGALGDRAVAHPRREAVAEGEHV
jgi:hypothetical protein